MGERQFIYFDGNNSSQMNTNNNSSVMNPLD